MKNKLTIALSVAVCLIMLTAAVVPNMIKDNGSENEEYSKVINVSNDSFTYRLSQVADALSDSCSVVTDDDGNITIAGSPTISDIFPEFDLNDSSMDLSIVEKDGTYTYDVKSDDLDLNEDDICWEYIYDDDGGLSDIVAVTDTERISLRQSYDSIENCFCLTATAVSLLLVVVVAAIVVTPIVIEPNNNGDDSGSNDDGNDDERIPVYPNPQLDIVVISTTGSLGSSLAWDAADYYNQGNWFKEISLYFRYVNCRWNEVIDGISINMDGDDLLAVAVNGTSYSIDELNNSDDMGVNNKDENSHYCTIVWRDDAFIIPKRITFTQAQNIMKIESNKGGLISTWTKDYNTAFEVASVIGPAVGPEISYMKGCDRYYHFHTTERKTGAHSFYGGPVQK